MIKNAIGTYNGVEIFWDGDDPGQFINATQMCKAAGKRWAKYWENQSTQEFVAILAEDLSCPNSDLIKSTPVRGDLGGGTWVHVDIALHLAQWCCPKFHLWCNRQIRKLVTTGRVAKHREHQEAELYETRVWKTLDKIAEIQLSQRSEISVIHQKVERVENDVIEIREAVRSRRIPLSEKTKKQHVDTVHFNYHGICPCCRKIEVVDSGGRKTKDGEFDHFEMRSKNGPQDTWLVCKGCNSKLRDSEFKRARKHAFEDYQVRRKERQYTLPNFS